MSRTYRIRNLPRFGAQKFVDGGAGWGRSRHHEHYRQLAHRLLGDGYAALDFSNQWRIERELERSHPVPAANLCNHPWVSWSRVGGCKTWYKRHGNRWGRQRGRALLRKVATDETYDDRRPFPRRRQELWDIWSVT
jgi:hypothetical protein